MGRIVFPMSDIYGGFAGTTEATIPDADDKNALTDTTEANRKPVEKTVTKASNKKLYLTLILILIIVIILGGRY